MSPSSLFYPGELLEKPGATELPIPLHGDQRYLELLGDLGKFQAAEKSHFNHCGFTRLLSGQAIQQSVDVQNPIQIDINRIAASAFLTDAKPGAVPLLRHARAQVIDHELTHGPAGKRQVVCATLPGAAAEPQVCLVHEHRGLKGRMGDKTAEMDGCNVTQLAIDRLQLVCQRNLL